MPNTPAQLGYGITGLFATANVFEPERILAENVLQAVGETVWIPEEWQMDIVTALSGSGPAYCFYIMEALINSAEKLGLPHDIASKLTLNTLLGSSFMALHSDDDLKSLQKKVTSPGGTTEEGINVLKHGKLEDLLYKTLQAAFERGKTLSKQFD